MGEREVEFTVYSLHSTLTIAKRSHPKNIFMATPMPWGIPSFPSGTSLNKAPPKKNKNYHAHFFPSLFPSIVLFLFSFCFRLGLLFVAMGPTDAKNIRGKIQTQAIFHTLRPVDQLYSGSKVRNINTFIPIHIYTNYIIH